MNNLFRHPYTKIDFVSTELGVHRQTASRYLDAMADLGLLTKHKIWKENYYLNHALFNLLLGAGGSQERSASEGVALTEVDSHVPRETTVTNAPRAER